MSQTPPRKAEAGTEPKPQQTRPQSRSHIVAWGSTSGKPYLSNDQSAFPRNQERQQRTPGFPVSASLLDIKNLRSAQPLPPVLSTVDPVLRTGVIPPFASIEPSFFLESVSNALHAAADCKHTSAITSAITAPRTGKKPPEEGGAGLEDEGDKAGEIASESEGEREREGGKGHGSGKNSEEGGAANNAGQGQADGDERLDRGPHEHHADCRVA